MKKIKFIKSYKKLFKYTVNLQNLCLPVIFNQDHQYLKKALKEKEVSTYGKYTRIFEKNLQRYTKSKYVISTINGSSAMHISMIASGIMTNHEVLMPSFNYISNANAVSNCGAIPHFVDCEEESLGICPKKWI